jgi:hypothetical protein
MARLEKLLSVLDPFELKEKIEKKLRVILRREVPPTLHKAPLEAEARLIPATAFKNFIDLASATQLCFL